MQLGFVGLGTMGSAMAGRLIAAGHRVTVWNRTRGKAEALAAAGATVAETPAGAAAAGVVLSMLTDDDALDQVCAGPDGLLAGLPEGGIHVSCGTLSLAASERATAVFAEAGRVFVAATVLGRPPAAQAGQLYVMEAGPVAALERIRPALEAIGQRVFRLGEAPRLATVAKLCCNFMIFSTIEQLAEVFAIGARAGIDRAAMFGVLTESFFSAPVHKNYGKIIVERAYDTRGTDVALALKDTGMMLAASEALGAPMPLAALVRDRLLACEAHGERERDFAILAREAERQAGL